MIPNSIWRRKLVSFGSATTLAVRELVVSAISGGDGKWDGDRIKDYLIEVGTALLISAALVIMIMMIWAEVLLVASWFLLFLLSETV